MLISNQGTLCARELPRSRGRQPQISQGVITLIRLPSDEALVGVVKVEALAR